MERSDAPDRMHGALQAQGTRQGPQPTRAMHASPAAQGTLFPMCGMNLAFDRDAIGPAMYFGLMGEGQPWGRYDGARAGRSAAELHTCCHSFVLWHRLPPVLRLSVLLPGSLTCCRHVGRLVREEGAAGLGC